MKTFLTTSCILLFSLVFVQAQDSVQLYRIEKDNGLLLKAKNTNLFPVTIQINLRLTNLKASARAPYVYVLLPQSDSEIMELEIIDKAKGWDYYSQYTYTMGDIHARHNDNFAYRLPYRKGETYPLSQGFHGSYSHFESQQYALDFTMPEGTSVYAARSGLVVDTEEGYSEGGTTQEFMDKANVVTILHDDGTFADYAHLRHQGVEVTVGQKVRTGQLLGYSGATGYAGGPHLHFIVKKAKLGKGYESIPVKFATKDGIIILEEGNRYIGY